MDGLVGRDAELDAIRGWLGSLTEAPATLVIEGEPGIGKSSVFTATVELARRSRLVLAALPVEPESGLAHAGLLDLLGQVDDDVIAGLPAPQRDALEVVLLRRTPVEDRSDRLAVGVAVRGALGALASRQPLLLAIDDAQWLDEATAEALRFALRRLPHESIGVVAARRPGAAAEARFGTGLPDPTVLRLAPMSIGAIHSIVQGQLGLTLDRPRLRRLHDLSNGNPFYALELARAFGAGSLTLGPGEGLPRDLESLVGDRIAALPPSTARLLAVAALAPDANLDLLRMVGPDDPVIALAPAIDAGVVRIADRPGAGVEFVHPLLASAAIARLGADDRREVHLALADAVTDRVERARHIARSVVGADEGVAALLEDAATEAMRRGAPSVAADLAAVAREATPSDRATDADRRAATEAEYRFEAGDGAGAAEILDRLIERLHPGPARAKVLGQRARVAHFGDDVGAGVALLRAALAEAGPSRALRAGIEEGLAWGLMLMRADLSDAVTHAESAARHAARIGDDALRAEALAATALTRLVVGRPSNAPMRKALALEPATLGLRVLRHPTFALGYQLSCRDELDAARDVFGDLAARANDRGDESAMATILVHLALIETLAGNLATAARSASEAHELAVASGQRPARAAALSRMALVHATAGDEAATRGAADASLRLAGGDTFDPARPAAALARGGELSLWAMSLLHASLGQWTDVLRFAGPLADHMIGAGVREPGELRFLLDEIEALVATGRAGMAARRVDLLQAIADGTRRPSARVAVAIGRSLLAGERGDLEDAESVLERAAPIAEELPLPLLHGRLLLVLGRVRRRSHQRTAARATLTAARDRFSDIGAALWVSAAEHDLGRIGGRKSSGRELTATEAEVARLVATGLSNKEVAAALFVTPKAIEATLARVFAKRGVRSRTELAHLMGGEPADKA